MLTYVGEISISDDERGLRRRGLAVRILGLLRAAARRCSLLWCLPTLSQNSAVSASVRAYLSLVHRSSAGSVRAARVPAASRHIRK